MKKLFFSALIYILIGPSSYSQDYIPSRDDIQAFFNTKTLVVLQDNPLLEYNQVIQDVMKQEWTITEFEFISYKEFEEKRFDPQYSFCTCRR